MTVQSKVAVADCFSTAQAAAFAGLSLAMVNYLCRHGLICPLRTQSRGRGIQRWFGFGDLVILRVIRTLLEGGVSVSRLKRALVSLRAHHPEITPDRLPATYLVTDGKNVMLRHKSGVFELLTTGQFSFAFVIELAAVQREALDFAIRRARNTKPRAMARITGRSAKKAA